MERLVWVVNKAQKVFEKTDIDLKKHLIFKPFIPVQMPVILAMKYARQYRTLSICPKPEEYFKDRKLRQLIIRDAGIGDLLLLEPVVRQLVKNGERIISICSRFPEVYQNNPFISENFKQELKEKIPEEVNYESYDALEDLRSYSETCVNRDKLNRTDCYNQKFKVNLEDPEPRLYFDKSETSILKKKKGRVYIGLACDGSHSYRRYEKYKELIDHILKNKPEVQIVLMGSYDFMEYPKNNRVMDLQKKTDIREAINVVRNLDFLVSVDSGLMHVALCMHIPTVCIFSIIKPNLRLHYYKGPHEIVYRDSLPCIGCGSLHMAICRHGNKDKDFSFIAPCLDIPPEEIYNKLISMEPNNKRRMFYSDGSEENEYKPKPAIIRGKKKLIMPIIVLNEEKNLPRFIDNVMKHPSIGKVIAIDGGSNDRTVEMLEKAGAFVYTHLYDKDYHDMQAMQRNYSCSFIRDGEKIIIMDVDECFSKELSEYLPLLAESDIVYGVISRRTFDYYRDINDSNKQIKDYPDWQPRFYTWDRRYKWIGSPHHQLYNAPAPVKIRKDIIHFEKEGKDRVALEAKWTQMDKATRAVYA